MDRIRAKSSYSRLRSTSIISAALPKGFGLFRRKKTKNLMKRRGSMPENARRNSRGDAMSKSQAQMKRRGSKPENIRRNSRGDAMVKSQALIKIWSGKPGNARRNSRGDVMVKSQGVKMAIKQASLYLADWCSHTDIGMSGVMDRIYFFELHCPFYLLRRFGLKRTGDFVADLPINFFKFGKWMNSNVKFQLCHPYYLALLHP